MYFGLVMCLLVLQDPFSQLVCSMPTMEDSSACMLAVPFAQ